MIIDKITWYNKKEILAYSGEEEGQFFWQQDKKIDIGTYKGGKPDISSANFYPAYTYSFKTEGEAKKKAIKMAGKPAVISLFYGDLQKESKDE